MKERMTRYERIQAAYNLEEADRVPVAPILVYIGPYLTQMTIKEALRNADKLVDAYLKYQDLTGDMVYPFMTGLDHMAMLGKAGWDQTTLDWRIFDDFPPKGNVPNLYEKDIIEDYDDVMKRGFSTILFNSKLENDIFHRSIDDFLYFEFEYPKVFAKAWQRFVEKTGIPLMNGGRMCHPLDLLQYYRGMMNLTRDIFEQPEKVRAICDWLCEYEAFRAMRQAMTMGAGEVPGAETIVFINGGPPGMSPRIFDEFYFPYAKKMTDIVVKRGFKAQCHWDNDLTPHLKTIKQLSDGLPKGYLMMDFEKTDMKKAKEMIGDTIALYGAVPSALLVYGTYGEVEECCKKLIEDCAEGGGFILGAECEAPWDSKPENIRAMIETAQKYGQY
jgi:uroporphyrinogen-III decarboxylase